MHTLKMHPQKFMGVINRPYINLNGVSTAGEVGAWMINSIPQKIMDVVTPSSPVVEVNGGMDDLVHPIQNGCNDLAPDSPVRKCK